MISNLGFLRNAKEYQRDEMNVKDLNDLLFAVNLNRLPYFMEGFGLWIAGIWPTHLKDDPPV